MNSFNVNTFTTIIAIYIDDYCLLLTFLRRLVDTQLHDTLEFVVLKIVFIRNIH